MKMCTDMRMHWHWHDLFFCVTIIFALPETGELDGQRLRLALFPDHHFVKKPTAASTPTIVADTDPAHLAQGHGLNEKLVMLRGRRGEKLKMLAAHFPDNICLFSVFAEC